MNLLLGVALAVYVVVWCFCWHQRVLDVLHDREVFEEHGIGQRPRWYEYLMTPVWGTAWPVFFLIVLVLELPRDKGRY